MPDLGAEIKAHLDATPGIAAALPGGLHGGTIPKNRTLPAATYRQSLAQPVIHLTGTSQLRRSRLHIEIVATTPTAAKTASETIRAALQPAARWQANLSPNNAIRLDSTELVDAFETAPIPPADAQDVWRYPIIMIWEIVHSET